MILIAHRGNIQGKSDKLVENSIPHINKALSLGYHCEVDVWFIDGKFKLGHDTPDHDVDVSFLINDSIWCHAKNVETLFELLKYPIHTFCHDQDDGVLTTKRYIWTFPGKQLTTNSIAVMPEVDQINWTIDDLKICAGICTDNVLYYESQLNVISNL